jgi:hypothetical protein
MIVQKSIFGFPDFSLCFVCILLAWNVARGGELLPFPQQIPSAPTASVPPPPQAASPSTEVDTLTLQMSKLSCAELLEVKTVLGRQMTASDKAEEIDYYSEILKAIAIARKKAECAE